MFRNRDTETTSINRSLIHPSKEKNWGTLCWAAPTLHKIHQKV